MRDMSLPESLIILQSSLSSCLALSLYFGPSIITSTFTFKVLTEGFQNVTKRRYMNVWRKWRILTSIWIHLNLAIKKRVTCYFLASKLQEKCNLPQKLYPFFSREIIGLLLVLLTSTLFVCVC